MVFMILETQAVGPFFKNGFVVGCETTREAVLIDPGDEVKALLSFAERNTLTIRHILLTHAHVDHVTGVAAAKDRKTLTIRTPKVTLAASSNVDAQTQVGRSRFLRVPAHDRAVPLEPF
jgi:glyoxylase-like metal-dependent hydrolase (beta-lactamase superfamily II)